MLLIYDQNNTCYVIRPCPFINITWNANSNESVTLGGKYDIVLTGTLLSHAGSPVFTYNQRNNPTTATQLLPFYYPRPVDSTIPLNAPEGWELGSIVNKQLELRHLFSKKCMKIELLSTETPPGEPILYFYPKLISMNFSDGVWVNKCDYTINLEAQFLLDRTNKVIASESYASKTFYPGVPGWPAQGAFGQLENNLDINLFLDKIGGFVEDFQESWSLEPEDGNGNTVDPYSGSENIVRTYRLTRNLSAKGKDITGYECFGNRPQIFYQAHEQARRYIVNHINNSGITSNDYDDYPGDGRTHTLAKYFASGLIDLSALNHGGYNHSRTENFDITQGTFSVQDSWILSSGTSFENYTLSLNKSENDSLVRVTIDGTIKGLTSIPADGSLFGGTARQSPPYYNTAYENAINKYREITNGGKFGFLAYTFKRAQNAAGAFHLNEKPLSIALSTNEIAGEINYTIEYDSRPRNFLNGVSFEGISVNDTYPGDVFSVIPVIGRPTGPVLQYIGGRTEYQRALSIELVVEPNSYEGINPNRPDFTEFTSRQDLLQKPSLVSPTKEGLIDVINAYSPGREPGIRKYFVAPPQETWDPKTGRYTLNINWTYELNY